MSDDRKHALTIIALLGSVFSPYYARSIESGAGEPLDHCSMNVALYGPREGAWAMTERDRGAVARSARSLAIGPSSMEWTGDGLRVAFDEITAPIPSRVRGSLCVKPLNVASFTAALDASGKHLWAPIAPGAIVEVELTEPSLRWRGSAYFDSNMGDEPLARAFSSWTWSRACDERRALVTYDVSRVDGTSLSLAKSFDASGSISDLPPLESASLGRTGWGLSRAIPVDRGATPRLLKTLEDTPFYARSLASARLEGREVDVVHEALSLDRFQKRWVQHLIPFRMRRGGA